MNVPKLKAKNFFSSIKEVHLCDIKGIDSGTYAGPSGRAVLGIGQRPLACCDRGFESYRGHGCLSVVCVVLSGRSLCDGLVTRSEESGLPTVARRCV
jgi:hypothetical protein